MGDRYFSPGEVQALIPRLTAIMERTMAAHGEAAEARERLQAEQRRITLAGGGVFDRERWRADQAQAERATAALQDGLEEIVTLGGVPKDLGQGLVDFPHLRDGLEVELCWKMGEREIRFWHGRAEGFAGRKPL
ncbi:MAG: DUF2203 domain-containing protein [Candidatus Rokubacteria bacterium]|nr:DUF2203 domain-containing protein [Candidatus Rokubacteria bacterium]MBI3826576.1 DUF2203 domain-containing protein [Candidatus Rokubacteria bacterium]